MPVQANLIVFTSNGTWTKPVNLQAIDLVLRGAGGGGNSTKGGGGGAAVNTRDRIPATDLPDTVAITVGAGGSTGADGGDSSFGDIYTAPHGNGATNGGQGGLSFMEGGDGGAAAGQAGESVSSQVIRLLAGGGGGGGSGASGGKSGLVAANTSSPPLWQALQSGGGGNSGSAGGFPAGGGGANAPGANGCVTVIEYIQT
ncbi:hypothetical protein [Nocardia sp. NPDC019302]|uniref:glycine-rich domain-containing protein n=1 Tax=Nocardia sp. NPDC019302 TaxID=3154592 RepID=UPI0033F9A985